jgi:hypothetical protein
MAFPLASLPPTRGRCHRLNCQIAKPSLRANGSRECAPDDRSAKQSIAPQRTWISSLLCSSQLTAEVHQASIHFKQQTISERESAISPRIPREFCFDVSPSELRGRRECRGARCARSRVCSVESTRVSHHGHTGNTRHSPRNGFNGFLRALPGDRACLPPSPADLSSANLTPASGRQDHTTSPSALAPFASKRQNVHRIPCPTFVTMAKRPSGGPEQGGRSHRSPANQSGIFSDAGLDRANQIEAFQ